MKEKNIRKLTIAGVLVAVAVVGSLFSIPVFGAKCSPVQHMVNVLGAVLLGPGYAVGMAFAAALIRNLLGLGSLLAFPGSMIGALLCGVAYRLCPKLPAAYAGRGIRAPAFWAALRPTRSPLSSWATPRRRCSPLYRASLSRLRSARRFLSSCCPRSSARMCSAALRGLCVDRRTEKSD